jgi:hypothetical protein
MNTDGTSLKNGRAIMETADIKIKPAYKTNLGTRFASTKNPITTRPKRSKIDITAKRVAGSIPMCNEWEYEGRKNRTCGTPTDI